MDSEYYKSKQSVKEYIKMAEGHSGQALITKLKPFLKDNSSILELGTGPGTDWKILSETYQITGSDFSDEFLKRLKKKYSEGIFLKLNAVDLNTELQFNCIYSNKVLHHLSDSELLNSIKCQNEILYESGIVCHSFWYGEGEENFKGMFVNNHSNTEIEDFFSPYFEILVLENYSEFEEGDSILLIGRKK